MQPETGDARPGSEVSHMADLIVEVLTKERTWAILDR